MREYITIEGGSPIRGEVCVAGAKNSALPLVMATLLTAEECTLRNVPDLEDIAVAVRLLRSFGADARFANNQLVTRARSLTGSEAPYGLVKAMRASFWVLGPVLARIGEARVPLPGGDAIGTRPVDLHLDGLSRLGAELRIEHGVVIASAPGGLSPARIELAFPSVGATHHLLITAALIEGETVINGAAQEPEVVDLAEMLTQMGAAVEGAGTKTVRVYGRRELGGAKAGVLGDRIEAATYLAAGAMTRGNVIVRGIAADSVASTIDILRQAGADVEITNRGIELGATERLRGVSFATAPFPGVATDVQPLLMAALTCAEGTSVIRETVFESRYGHVAEYRRLGADIQVSGRIATIKGVERLSGAPVTATDIRAAAGLVLMGLAAEGKTDIYEIHHLDRGYESCVEKFGRLGARISRSPVYEDREIVIGC